MSFAKLYLPARHFKNRRQLSEGTFFRDAPKIKVFDVVNVEER
jgi:hypothetical protein